MASLKQALRHFVFRPMKQVARRVWCSLPNYVLDCNAMKRLGHLVYDRHVDYTERVQSHYTSCMRNQPLLEVVAAMVGMLGADELSITSIGCSTGAELYSAIYVLRLALPRSTISGLGIDLTADVVDIARRGVYRPVAATRSRDPLRPDENAELSVNQLARLSSLVEARTDGTVRVKNWVRDRISWRVLDASDRASTGDIEPQHVVLANNFMGPMTDRVAESCLRNVRALVRPGGLLVIEGVNFDLKARVAADLRLEPVLDRLEDIYWADSSKHGWPWTRWSHEPIDRTRPDWRHRYSMIFRCP